MNMNWTTLVPPYQESFTTYGHCGGACTREALPKDGITIIGGFVHTHSLGRQLVARHFRNGRELPEIMRDSGYDPKYQEARAAYESPVKIYAGRSHCPGVHL
ncbi:PREDICTED: MOXD1 homolog 1-like [Priapulus caudatus]|uniref:MOXD1 homolog 1-like n=1 Tax=Priapulus caudatus TaxID=37621 RepID=A0ABM1EDB1_PRICU|nr:PREDICTED: MOXD1 homolog 1-like [Priapulus caudatus]